MKKFLINIVIFLFPLFLFTLIPISVLIVSKENFFKIDHFLNHKEKYLIGYAYNENNYHYMKWTYLNLYPKRDVWILGSSRVLQFREQMFNSTFYNAGYTILGINDYRSFLDSIPKSNYPKYIIIGLDQWMLNERHDNLNKTKSKSSWVESFSFYPKSGDIFNVYKDLFNHKYNFIRLLEDFSLNKIGLNAKINNKGFLNDGSMSYGNQIDKLISEDKTASDYDYQDTYDRITNGKSPFEYGVDVNKKALIELEEFLKFCKENHIQIVAFLPPFANKVYQRMTDSGNYKYLDKIYPEVKPIFSKYNYEIYDFSNLQACDSTDNEMLDGFHGSEVTYQRLLIKILELKSVLNEITDVSKLKEDLINRKNNYVIYDY